MAAVSRRAVVQLCCSMIAAMLLLVHNVQSFAFQQRSVVATTKSTNRLYGSSISTKFNTEDPSFLTNFYHTNSDCDDGNIPPSLNILKRSLRHLASGSDIRGTFVDHARVGSIANVAHSIGSADPVTGSALTPLAAHCLGHAFGRMILLQQQQDGASEQTKPSVCIGQDPRPHGTILADAFARGVQASGCKVEYTGIATTPSMSEFVRSNFCHGAVMVTASHLPVDRNGFKFFTKGTGGFTKQNVHTLIQYAIDELQNNWFPMGILPPSSGTNAVFAQHIHHTMPYYIQTLKDSLCREVGGTTNNPLSDLKIVLNTGNGSGGFFTQVLKDLGGTVVEMGIEPDGTFPNGVPNPEYASMLNPTMSKCYETNADLGIMLDTDADRSGFIVPSSKNNKKGYEVFNRNRLIALMGVIYSQTHPGCSIVTDSCTSEGLSTFLTETLKLNHVRYMKGYANVIGKAKELTKQGIADAQVAIETSGHCALQENDYLDDGTYTAVKVLGQLAKLKAKDSGNGNNNIGLMDLISEMVEMPIVDELRCTIHDGSLDTTKNIFDFCMMEIERECSNNNNENKNNNWILDTENLEGIRVRLGKKGSYFMLRKSLHDPVISLGVEGTDKEMIRNSIIRPLLDLFSSDKTIMKALDMTSLEDY